MKIAFPTNDKINVEEHFGHCAYFALVDVQEGKIVKTEFVASPEHAPGVMPKFLGEQKANVIITGGMGSMAINLFTQQNIQTVLGASGSIENLVSEYLAGNLTSKGSACTAHESGCH